MDPDTILRGLDAVTQFTHLPVFHILGQHSGDLSIWSWFPDPFVIMAVIGVSWWYLRAIGPQRETYAESSPVSRWRVGCFFGSLVTIILALLSPLEPLSDGYLLSAHMIQHLMLTIMFPILLFVGIPRWLYLPFTTWRGGAPWRIWMQVTRPVPAFVLFQVPFALSHLPIWYDMTLRQPQVHVLEHWIYMAGAMIGWWAIVAPDRQLGRLQPLLAVLFLFVSTIPGQVVGAMITYSEGPLYPTYAAARRVWDIGVMEDQELAGLIMWVGTSTIYLGALALVFFRWAANENRKETQHYVVRTPSASAAMAAPATSVGTPSDSAAPAEG